MTYDSNLKCSYVNDRQLTALAVKYQIIVFEQQSGTRNDIKIFILIFLNFVTIFIRLFLLKLLTPIRLCRADCKF